MASGQLVLFDKAKLNFFNATNLMNAANTFKASLHASGYAPLAASHEVLADLSNELANGNGYVTGGLALTGVALTLIPAQTISSITKAGQVATVTTAIAHGLSTGMLVPLAGQDDPLYSGTFKITVTGATSYTYTMTGTPAANAATVGTYGGVIKFTCNPIVWTATGGSIPAWRNCVIRAVGTLNAKVDPLLGYFLGDSTPADIPATTVGNTLTITANAGGLVAGA